MFRSSAAALMTIFLLALSASAQSRRGEPLLFTLTSGETVEARVLRETKKVILVENHFGRREIAADEIVARRDPAALKKAYLEQLQKIEKKDIDRRLRLARWCLARGFLSGLAAELDAVLRLDGAQAGAWSIIRHIAPRYRLAKRNIQPEGKPRWQRKEVDLQYAAARKTSFLGAAVIRSNLDALPIKIQINAAIDHAERGTEPQRWIAAHALGRSKETRRVKPLYRRALGDPSEMVRAEAMRSLKKHDDGTTIGPFVKALLEAQYDATRIHAAEALGELGDMRAIPPLITALATAGSGGAPRNHVRFGRQTAYVKDYDVEIAQAAVIADPIVDIVEEGVVLDVALVSVGIRRRIFRGALARLVGRDLGADPKVWDRWWRDYKEREKRDA